MNAALLAVKFENYASEQDDDDDGAKSLQDSLKFGCIVVK